jgi:hypothetical protein
VSAIIGLGLIFAGILVFRVAAAGTLRRPPAWWSSDAMSANITVPFSVGALGFGVAESLSWAFGGEWRSLTLFQGIGIAAVIATYVLADRVIKAWSRRLRSGEAVAVPGVVTASVPAASKAASV